LFVLTTESKAAAAVRIGAGTVLRERGRLLEALRPCFARTQVWLRAGKYVAALMSGLPERNGWSIARFCGDKTPDRTQRLPNHASRDTMAAMSIVRRFAVAGLDKAARQNRRQGGMRAGALDETGQEKQGSAAAGVKRQYTGCAGRVANGINTVHLAYVREGTGHALAGAAQWIPREQVSDPVTALAAGLPEGLVFRTRGQLAAGLRADAHADGARFDFICGDEVYGSSPDLREYPESAGQACVLRVASNFPVTLAGGITATCAQAVRTLLKDKRSREVRSAGTGSKGQRWYARARLAAASPRRCLLIRRHLAPGELAFHYCHVPEGQVLTKARLIRAAGLRWPAEDCFAEAKNETGLDHYQVRRYRAWYRHVTLAMLAHAFLAVAAHAARPREPVPASGNTGNEPVIKTSQGLKCQACGCRKCCHPMRPAHIRGSGRRAGPGAECACRSLRQADARARRAAPAAVTGAGGERCSGRHTRRGLGAGYGPAGPPTPPWDAR
jgi:SRSO17 transposase